MWDTLKVAGTCKPREELPGEDIIKSKRPLGANTKDDGMGHVAQYNTYLAVRKISKSSCTDQHGWTNNEKVIMHLGPHLRRPDPLGLASMAVTPLPGIGHGHGIIARYSPISLV
jgi:hypothetical protein